MRSEPAVVLLPGPTDSWRSYGPVLDRLPHWIRAIAVSQRGHGDSDKIASGYGIKDFAGDVVELLNALGIDRAVLVGHSGSCLVARRVALDHPHRIAGLVLEASPTSLRNDKARQFVNSVVMGLADPIDPGFARSFVTDTSSDNVAAELVDILVEDILKVPARVWHATVSIVRVARRSAGSRRRGRRDRARSSGRARNGCWCAGRPRGVRHRRLAAPTGPRRP